MIVMVGLAQSAPQNTNEVVRTVTTQLQPLISDAVAKALASFNSVSTSSVSSFGSSSAAGAARGLTEDEELEYNRKLSANAQYNYNYKVNDPDASTFMAHEESREGENVQGQYSYVDSTGALVTVTYTAGPDGYNEDRTVQEGAVSGHAERDNGPWPGPYAGVTGAGVTAAVKTPAPRPAPRPAPARPAPARAAPAVDQSALTQLILQQLQPQISSAVQSAISSSRTVSAPARSVQTSSSSVEGLFAGDNSVRINTPEFNIEY